MIQVLFFQGVSTVSKLIRWQTRGPVSHVALRWGDQAIEAWHVPFPGGRVYLHKTMKDCMAIHTPGTRVEVYRLTGATHTELKRVADKAWDWAKQQAGRKYDLRMVLRFLPRLKETIGSQENWFCSELVAAAFEHAKYPLLPRAAPCYLSPRDLYVSPRLSYSHTVVFDPAQKAPVCDEECSEPMGVK